MISSKITKLLFTDRTWISIYFVPNQDFKTLIDQYSKYIILYFSTWIWKKFLDVKISIIRNFHDWFCFLFFIDILICKLIEHIKSPINILFVNWELTRKIFWKYKIIQNKNMTFKKEIFISIPILNYHFHIFSIVLNSI